MSELQQLNEDVENSSNNNWNSSSFNDEAEIYSFSHVHLEENQDQESFDEFVRKYGDINVQYIKKPKVNSWFISTPYALNFFYNGTLYRTRNDRGESSTIELFLDLMYVGIVAKLASAATENASGGSLLQYILLFLPIWQIWTDIKDFMNYYFNDDLSQKLYIIWILSLLIVYANSAEFVLDDRSGTASVVVPYILARISLSIALWVYSYFVPQHAPQIRLYAGFLVVTSLLWLIVIFVDSTRGKIIASLAIIFMEHLTWAIAYHPYTKKALNLKYSTALNIEHEVERYGAFYVIAIGEFLYKIVASGSFGPGVTVRVGRAIMLLIISYVMLCLYFNGDGSIKAVHAIRRNMWSALAWLETHLFVIGSLILAADAAGDLCSFTDEYTGKPDAHTEEHEEEGEEKEVNRYALSLMFTGGICVCVICLTILAMLDKTIEEKDIHRVRKMYRLLPRAVIAIAILCLSFGEVGITRLFGSVMCLLVGLLIYELAVCSLFVCGEINLECTTRNLPVAEGELNI